MISFVHAAFHAWNVKLHNLSPLKPYLQWQVLDRGTGNISGMSKFLSSFDSESAVDDKCEGGGPITSDSDEGNDEQGLDEPDFKHLEESSSDS